MKRHELELRKQRLDEQLQEGIELLQAAHRQQVRALELVFQMASDEDLGGLAGPARPAVPPSAPELPPPGRQTLDELLAEVEEALARVPETFDRNDICRAIGYEPDRNRLYKGLRRLEQEGVISAEFRGDGQRAARYRKTGAEGSPAEG
jgi:hypothetical protein